MSSSEADDRATGPELDASIRAKRAKDALELVCAGASLEQTTRYYSAGFVDHVNDLEFCGLAGVERSVNLYRKLLTDLTITVEEQLAQGDRVTSRFVISGSSYGRCVRFNGITISRFDNGLIVEDWSVTDTLGMLRQLGLLRSLLVGARSIGVLAAPKR
jgi:predicted ester cyclase